MFAPGLTLTDVWRDVDHFRLVEPLRDVPANVVADGPPRRKSPPTTVLETHPPLRAQFIMLPKASLQVDVFNTVARHVFVVAIDKSEGRLPIPHPTSDSSVVSLPEDELVLAVLVHVVHHRLHELRGETIVTILPHMRNQRGSIWDFCFASLLQIYPCYVRT